LRVVIPASFGRTPGSSQGRPLATAAAVELAERLD
jgi:hypothetical protein